MASDLQTRASSKESLGAKGLKLEPHAYNHRRPLGQHYDQNTAKVGRNNTSNGKAITIKGINVATSKIS
jgi:hypothetical protein